jgi:hypothetical protein
LENYSKAVSHIDKLPSINHMRFTIEITDGAASVH